MLTNEQIAMVAQLMSMNPGLSEADAIAAVKGMVGGELGTEGTTGVIPPTAGPAMGTIPGDVPQVTPSLMNPQGEMTPRPETQEHPLCGPGTVFNGTQCVLATTL